MSKNKLRFRIIIIFMLLYIITGCNKDDTDVHTAKSNDVLNEDITIPEYIDMNELSSGYSYKDAVKDSSVVYDFATLNIIQSDEIFNYFCQQTKEGNDSTIQIVYIDSKKQYSVIDVIHLIYENDKIRVESKDYTSYGFKYIVEYPTDKFNHYYLLDDNDISLGLLEYSNITSDSSKTIGKVFLFQDKID